MKALSALVADPGGVLNARRSASRTAAFQRVHAVGFLSLWTTTLHISGLNTEPAPLSHPPSDSRDRAYPRTALLTCWLDFGQVGLGPYRPSPTWEYHRVSCAYAQSHRPGCHLTRARLGSARNWQGRGILPHFLPAVLASVSPLAPPYWRLLSHQQGVVRCGFEQGQQTHASPTLA